MDEDEENVMLIGDRLGEMRFASLRINKTFL